MRCARPSAMAVLLAYEHGVVLGAAAEYLQDAAYFLVTSDDGVELAGAGALVEVDGVFGEGVVGVLGALVGGLLALAELVYGGLEVPGGEAGVLEDGGGRRVDVEDGQEDGLEGDVFVALLLGYVERFLQHVVAGAAEVWLAARDLGLGGDGAVDLCLEGRGVGANLLEDEFD